MLSVHDDLIPPRSPHSPSESQRSSDSASLNGHRRSHPARSMRDTHTSNRYFRGTSPSIGDQTRNLAQSPEQAEAMQDPGCQPLTVFRSRREMLKESIAASPTSGGRSPETPTLSGRTELNEPSGRAGSSGMSHCSTQEGDSRQQSRQKSSSGVTHCHSRESSSRDSY
jgi:hypothetical protein